MESVALFRGGATGQCEAERACSEAAMREGIGATAAVHGVQQHATKTTRQAGSMGGDELVSDEPALTGGWAMGARGSMSVHPLLERL